LGVVGWFIVVGVVECNSEKSINNNSYKYGHAREITIERGISEARERNGAQKQERKGDFIW
jgi:hypothetical protein